MTPRPIRFLHRGTVAEAAIDSRAAATCTVMQWLRGDAGCTGTKEGCNEGDCGACMVVVGSLDAKGALRLEPINSCIRFLPTLDGRALFTVEDLAQGGVLHPVQQALVDCHGSQCGFCTPGFVMTMWAMWERHRAAGTMPTRQQVADDLSGNLCRCTGYRPIVDAALRMFDAPATPLDRLPVVAALQRLQADAPLTIDGCFHAPRALDDLAALRAARPEARLLAGSTDIGLWVTKQMRDVGELIALGDVSELQRIEIDDEEIHIGAGASLEAAFAALAHEWPELRDVWLRFASVPIRLAGTIGGNVANGSPIGDVPPLLMALGASLLLRRGTRTRTVPLDDFYLAYLKNRLQPGEFVQAIQVPRRADRAQRLRVYKISKRYDSDISAVCAALAIEVDGSGRVVDVRFAFGGMAATVRRAAHAEAASRHQPWTEATLQASMAALAVDFTPLSDMRASAGYRLQTAQNLLRRFWLATRADAPLAESQLNVWARDAATGASV